MFKKIIPLLLLAVFMISPVFASDTTTGCLDCHISIDKTIENEIAVNGYRGTLRPFHDASNAVSNEMVINNALRKINRYNL